MLPYLHSLKSPFSILRMLYNTVLMPSLTYGLNATSLTKVNRSSLARREHMMIQTVANISEPPMHGHSVNFLLNGKTINKRVSAYRLRYYCHILRRPDHSILKRGLRLQP